MRDFSSNLISEDSSIWRYLPFYPSLDKKFLLTLGEGGTPLVEKEGIYFKSENSNPSGSIKDRGVSAQLSYAAVSDQKRFVISSSGNAGISAAIYSDKFGFDLTIFISPRTPEGKFSLLRELKVDIKVTEKPLFESLKFAQETGSFHLRQSRDDKALVGYSSLSYELFEQFRDKTPALEIFFPVSSAATLVGVGGGFLNLWKKGYLAKLPRLHAVQTTSIHPVSGEFVKVASVEFGLGLASALCAPKTPLKDQAVDLIKESLGNGWVVSEQEIKDAWSYLDKCGISTSAEGAVSLAGVFQARQQKILTGMPICLLTGTRYD